MVQTGISDGSSTEVISKAVGEGDEVIVGIEQPRSVEKSGDLPPGFGIPADNAVPHATGHVTCVKQGLDAVARVENSREPSTQVIASSMLLCVPIHASRGRWWLR